MRFRHERVQLWADSLLLTNFFCALHLARLTQRPHQVREAPNAVHRRERISLLLVFESAYPSSLPWNELLPKHLLMPPHLIGFFYL